MKTQYFVDPVFYTIVQQYEYIQYIHRPNSKYIPAIYIKTQQCFYLVVCANEYLERYIRTKYHNRW